MCLSVLHALWSCIVSAYPFFDADLLEWLLLLLLLLFILPTPNTHIHTHTRRYPPSHS